MNHNILFFLTPKAMCAYVYDDYTVRQALEKMEANIHAIGTFSWQALLVGAVMGVIVALIAQPNSVPKKK